MSALPDRINLLDLDREGMRQFFMGLGEKPFRGDQIMKWIYHRGVCDFEEMTDLGKKLRAKLEGVAEIVPPVNALNAAKVAQNHLVNSVPSGLVAITIPVLDLGVDIDGRALKSLKIAEQAIW